MTLFIFLFSKLDKNENIEYNNMIKEVKNLP